MTPQDLWRESEKYLGVQEIEGTDSNPIIDDWLLRHGQNINPNYVELKGDIIPWCSVYVGQVVEDAGLEGTGHALARSWMTWGKPGKLVPGAIVVIRRRDRKTDGTSGRGGFHVGFFKRMTKHFIWLRGGNQRNQVSDQAFSKKNYQVLSIRVPSYASV